MQQLFVGDKNHIYRLISSLTMIIMYKENYYVKLQDISSHTYMYIILKICHYQTMGSDSCIVFFPYVLAWFRPK